MRWLDLAYSRLANRGGKFFADGWGDPELLATSLVRLGPPPPIRVSIVEEQRFGDRVQQVGWFESPHPCLPAESRIATFQLVLPASRGPDTPVCVLLAATGDQGFESRLKLVALPLLRHGIGTAILENPFYGLRRPCRQVSTYVRSVSELWAMGMAAVGETRALLGWLKERGFQRLGVAGASMGGQIASQAAALWPHPLAMCACVAPHSAETVFLEGVLRNYCDWKRLGADARDRLRRQLQGTDLRIFPCPPGTDSSIWIAAEADAYVHLSSCRTAHQAWPGSHLRLLRTGHVGAVLLHRQVFLDGILESFKRLGA
ncbi:MAG: alpha/beta hydrolase family protein [Armatimonadetes bacterium]|nr:alpha/beta hydrolase family protein [Armatimonadota bacterium]